MFIRMLFKNSDMEKGTLKSHSVKTKQQKQKQNHNAHKSNSCNQHQIPKRQSG